MRTCLTDCLIERGLWVLGGAALAGVVAYILGVTGVVGIAVVASFPPGIVAALIAIAGVAVIGFVVAIGWCNNQCQRRR